MSKDHHHHCEDCGAVIRYRMVRGSSVEGISIREIYYDDKDKVIGWDDELSSPPGGSPQDIIEWLIFMFKDFDEMLEATKQPVIDEADLESSILDKK